MNTSSKSPFEVRRLSCAHGRSIVLGPSAVLMAIINVTPDSFSDGGQFSGTEEAVAFALKAIDDGAAIVDIGGESTRPGAKVVTAEEEQARVLPVIAAIAARCDALISIDTYRSSTARLAVEAGAHIVNDVSGGTADHSILDVVAQTGAGYCLMHTSRERKTASDPAEDQLVFLKPAVTAARAAGVADHQIMVDPGFGFGKDADDNLTVMARLDVLQTLGLPILIGTSRKRFVASVGGGEDNLTRDFGTAATSVITRLGGGCVFRVHNVPANRMALAFADAMIARGQGVLR